MLLLFISYCALVLDQHKTIAKNISWLKIDSWQFLQQCSKFTERKMFCWINVKRLGDTVYLKAGLIDKFREMPRRTCWLECTKNSDVWEPYCCFLYSMIYSLQIMGALTRCLQMQYLERAQTWLKQGMTEKHFTTTHPSRHLKLFSKSTFLYKAHPLKKMQKN